MNKILIFSIGSGLIGIIIGLVVGVSLPTQALTKEELQAIVETVTITPPAVTFEPFQFEGLENSGRRNTFNVTYSPVFKAQELYIEGNQSTRSLLNITPSDTIK